MSSIPLNLTPFGKSAKRAMAWNALGSGLLVSSIIGFILAVLDFYRVVALPGWALIGILVLGPLVGIGWALTRSISDRDLAESIDRRAGLKDQTSTALQLDGGSLIEPLLRSKATSTLESQNAKDLYPIRMKRVHWVAVSIAVVAAGVYYAGVSGVFLSSREKSERAEVQALAPTVEKIARDIKDPAADDPFGGQTQAITGNLEKFARDMEMGRIPKEEALTKANKILDDAKSLEEKRFETAKTGLNSAEASLKAMALDNAQKAMGEAAIPMSAEQKEVSSAQLSTDDAEASSEALKDQANALQSQIDGLKKQLNDGQSGASKSLSPSEVAKLQSALKEATAQQKRVETAKRAQDELSKMLSNPAAKELLGMADKLGKEIQRRMNGETPQMSDSELKSMSDRAQELKKQAGDNKAQQELGKAVEQALSQMKAASEMGEQMRKFAETMGIQRQLQQNRAGQAPSPELQQQLQKMMSDPKFAEMQKKLQDAMSKTPPPQGFLSKEVGQSVEKKVAEAESQSGRDPSAQETLQALKQGAKELQSPTMSPEQVDALKKALEEAQQIAQNGKKDANSEPVSPETQKAMQDLMNSMQMEQLQKAAEKAAEQAAKAAESAAKQLSKEDLQKLQELANTISERHPDDPALQPPLEAVQEQVKNLADGTLDKEGVEKLREAVSQAQSLAEKGKAEEGQPQASPQGQESMGELMGSPEMKKLQEALSAQAQSGQGQQSPMSQQDAQQMMQQMQQMAQQLQGMQGGQQLAQQMQQAMQSGGQGMNQQSMQQMMSALNAMRQASQGGGGDQGFGQGQLNKNSPFKDFKSGSKLGGIRGERGNQGSETYMDIKGPTRVGSSASVPYTKVITSYEKKAEKAISTKKIPKKREGRVKDYFESLRRGKP
jgi:hypothetical protein